MALVSRTSGSLLTIVALSNAAGGGLFIGPPGLVSADSNFEVHHFWDADENGSGDDPEVGVQPGGID